MELLGQNKIDRHQRQVVILSQDSFYRELTPEQKAKALKGQFNFDHPGTIRSEGCSRNPFFFLWNTNTIKALIYSQRSSKYVSGEHPDTSHAAESAVKMHMLVCAFLSVTKNDSGEKTVVMKASNHSDVDCLMGNTPVKSHLFM